MMMKMKMTRTKGDDDDKEPPIKPSPLCKITGLESAGCFQLITVPLQMDSHWKHSNKVVTNLCRC